MLDLGFGYWAIHAAGAPQQVTSMIARLRLSDGPLQAVVWDTRTNVWRFSPGTAAFYLFDEKNFDRSSELERPAAEDMARAAIGAELPSEQELRQICADGMRRWDMENDPDGFQP